MPSIKSVALAVAIVAVFVAAALTGSSPKSEQEAMKRGGALTVGIQPTDLGDQR